MESRHKRLALKKMKPLLFHFWSALAGVAITDISGAVPEECRTQRVVLLCYCHVNIDTVCLCKCVVKMKAFVLNQSCFISKVKEDFGMYFAKP